MSEHIVDTFGIVQDFADLHGDMTTPLYQAIMDVMVLRQREEIVRCRDCKHANHYHPLDWRTGRSHETLEEWYCNWHSNAEGASEIEPDGYCAWGERRGDAE